MDAGADGSAGWRGCHGRSLLGAAARGKNAGIASALLEAGVKPDVHVTYGDDDVRESALHVAAAAGAESVAEVLMSAGGADPNRLDCFNCSPLHDAAKATRHGIVAKLLLKELSQTPGPPVFKRLSTFSVSQACGQGADANMSLNFWPSVWTKTHSTTGVYLSVEHRHPQAVEILLAAGTDELCRSRCLGVSTGACRSR